MPLLYIHTCFIPLHFDLIDFYKILFGFKRSDDFWHRKTEFLATLQALSGLATGRSINLDKIDFPLEWYSKKDVLFQFNTNKMFKHFKRYCFSCIKSKRKWKTL